MKTQKLGRGLSALLGEMDDVYENEMHQKDMIVELQLKDIKANPFQPRKYFNDESLAELGESIKNDGLLQPVVVTEEIDGYVLIAGERRVRASRLAKLKTIRAIVLNSDEQKMRQLALIENIQRDELNAIELAHAYGELIKLHSITQDELSVKIHKSRTHITNTMRLLQLSAKTQKAIVEKKITAGHAKVLVGLEESTQQLIVDSIIGQKLSVRDVEAMIQNMKSSSTPKTPKEIEVAFDFSKLKYAFEHGYQGY
jgi:ParB family chromosome partitioning protein